MCNRNSNLHLLYLLYMITEKNSITTSIWMLLLKYGKFHHRSQRKFIDWKKTKLFRCRWNWVEEKKVVRHPSADFPLHSVGGDVEYCYCGENALERDEIIDFCEKYILKNKFLYISFQKSIHSTFKGIVSRDCIYKVLWSDNSSFLWFQGRTKITWSKVI